MFQDTATEPSTRRSRRENRQQRRARLGELRSLPLVVCSLRPPRLGLKRGKPHNPSAKNGRAGFHFLVLDQVAGTADRLIIQGDGNFNGNRASGGGTFDHFVAGTGPPATLVATGTWRATDVVSWTPGTSHGVYRGGTLIMHATVTPSARPGSAPANRRASS